jgi:thiol-disulfide isomerase/thioredoxin
MKKTLAILVLVLVLFVNSGVSISSKAAPDAPDITIREWLTDDNPDVSSTQGKVMLLDFWATWCSPCVKGIPKLIKLNNKYKDQGLELIALSQDKSSDAVRQLIEDKDINYHVAIDNGTADWYEIKGYPTMVVVNSEGKITWRGYPWQPGLENAIKKALEKAAK